MKLNCESAIIFWRYVVKILALRLLWNWTQKMLETFWHFEVQILAFWFYEIDPWVLFCCLDYDDEYDDENDDASTTSPKKVGTSTKKVTTTTGYSQHPWGIFFTILGTVLLDFDADACQSPSRFDSIKKTISTFVTLLNASSPFSSQHSFIGLTVGILLLNKGMSAFTSNTVLIPKQDFFSRGKKISMLLNLENLKIRILSFSYYLAKC